MEQNIRLDVNHMMADMLGSEYGVTQAQLAAMQDAAVKAQHAVEANRGTGWLGWMNLPYNQEEIVSDIEKVADHVRKTFKYFVVLGIGGSALGPIAVHQALNHLHQHVAPVVLPLHPRTRNVIAAQGLTLDVHLIEPVGYLEMIWLLQRTGLVLTDSGGVQKEAFFFGKACVTMRDQTEWVELIEAGANQLVGADTDKIIEAARRHIGRAVKDEHSLYGGGVAAKRIANFLKESK